MDRSIHKSQFYHIALNVRPMPRAKTIHRKPYKINTLHNECYIPNLASSSALTVSMTNGRLFP